TLGFCALKDLWVREPARPLPLKLEGTLVASDVSTRSDEGNTRHATLLVEGDLPATREGVVRQLASDKWTLLREAAGKSGGARTLVLELAKGREQMQVTISELEAGLCAVAQTWVGSDRPDAVP